MAIETIIHKDYKNNKFIVTTRAERYQIWLELLKNCILGLVSKMIQIFDNMNVSHKTKKLELKTVQIKLGLLNSALYITYGLKLKVINKKSLYYHLVNPFNSSNTSKLFLYQIGKEIY
ncbi:hypothetical protein C1645_819079 [Glomus cerebriforme]|uniref:Uncharacterized protein n=1 Tax=Glomus cerebriforme TaxID=658196 RepID=A0A397TFB7_9GLOM|nr:hypothetical protein C1645_819079 [Glomus cerebriforme]